MKFFYPLQDYFLDNAPGHHWDGNINSLDFAIPEGTKLYAIQTGIVVEARDSDSSSTGKMVALSINTQSYGEIFVTYMHMSQVYVKTGEKVQIGQVIGLSGNTGNSTGPHLHLQICKGIWYDSSNGITSNEQSGELYRESHPFSMSLNEKLFKYLKVQQGVAGGSSVPPSGLLPTSSMTQYYTKDYTAQEIQMSDTDASIIAQLAVNELGLGFSKEENAMNLGVYAKLIRSVYMKNSSPGDAILPILKKYGGFSGWMGRGYPTLEQAGTDTYYLEPVKMNLLSAGTYGLTGKYLQIARCYPVQNYGYGEYYPQSHSIESELENRILNQQIISHITINSGHTCLIGAIGNTGYFTNCDVIANISNYPESELLINSANISGV